VAFVVIVDGPDFGWVGLVGIHVDHPAKDMGEKESAGSVAGFLCMDGAEQAEFCVGTEVGSQLPRGRLAEIHVLMPARDAERNAAVDLVLVGVDAVSVHNADEFVAAIGSFAIEQRGGLERIKVAASRKSVCGLGEVILRLRQIGKKDLITIGQGAVVVLIRLHSVFRCNDDGVGFSLVSRLPGAQGRHVHVSGHVGHAAGHFCFMGSRLCGGCLRAQ
jgi:hypothetical protein